MESLQIAFEEDFFPDFPVGDPAIEAELLFDLGFEGLEFGE